MTNTSSKVVVPPLAGKYIPSNTTPEQQRAQKQAFGDYFSATPATLGQLNSQNRILERENKKLQASWYLMQKKLLESIGLIYKYKEREEQYQEQLRTCNNENRRLNEIKSIRDKTKKGIMGLKYNDEIQKYLNEARRQYGSRLDIGTESEGELINRGRVREKTKKNTIIQPEDISIDFLTGGRKPKKSKKSKKTKRRRSKKKRTKRK